MRVIFVVLAVSLLVLTGCGRAPTRISGPLSQDVYVWQRAQSPAVSESLHTHSGAFHATVVLVAEISWRKSAGQLTPLITRVPLDWTALHAVSHLGFAVRVNAYSGPFARDDATARTLAALARELLAEASAHGITLAELQIDFDAATSKLAGYREWIQTLRETVAPIPLTFTALPAWLRSDEFFALAHAADGFVLQVHSLARPPDAKAPFTLCDPIEAKRAIELAARIGVPFRVALPTYGYTLAFDPAGRFAGLSAEGPRPEWRDTFTVREVRANPTEQAALIRQLGADRPAQLTGVIWYRLPIAGDQLNWSWPTLDAVMRGRNPASHLRIESQLSHDGLLEFFLSNDGDGDFSGPVAVSARWKEAQRISADATGNFAITAEDNTSLRFASKESRVPAGGRRAIGCLRLSSPTLHPDVFLEN